MQQPHHYYHTPTNNTDLQKMQSDARRSLAENSEESVIHFHKHDDRCEGKRHVYITNTEGYV
jgi:hypothetical protein